MLELVMAPNQNIKVPKGTIYVGTLEASVRTNDKLIVIDKGDNEFHMPLWSIETFDKKLEQGDKGQEVGLFFTFHHPLPKGEVKIYREVV